MKKVLYLVSAFLLSACAARSTHTSMSDSVKSDSLKPVTTVLAEHTSEWMKILGVQGTGETKKDGKPAIMIFVDTLTPDLQSQLPSEVEGYPVVIQQSGAIHVLPAK